MLQHILLIRHAECLMNLHLSTTIGGRANDSPLTRRGKAQAEALAARLARLPERRRPELLFASTAARARETAEAVARALARAEREDSTPMTTTLPVTLCDDLLEIEMGEWAGKDRKSTYTDEVLEAIRRDPSGFAAPGGESQAQVEERVARYIEGVVLPAAAALAAARAEEAEAEAEAAATATPTKKRSLPVVAVVAHGVAIKAFLRRVIASEPDKFAAARNVALENTGICEVAVDTTKRRSGASPSVLGSGSAGGGAQEEEDGASPSSSSPSSWDRELWHLIRVNDAAHLEGMEEIGEAEEEEGEERGAEKEEEEEEEAASSPRIDR